MSWASWKEENDGDVCDKARTKKGEGLTQW